MRFRLMLVLCGVVALAVGVSTATAGGGNSDAAKACQQGGWQNLLRQDDTGFANQGDCVSYAAHGGRLQQACVAGSENFSEDAQFSTPNTFSGGTIDTAYGVDGGVRIQDSSWFGAFPTDTSVLFTGEHAPTFHLTFTKPVGSVQLQADANRPGQTTHQTLMGYEATNNVIATDTQTQTSDPVTLKITSATNKIKAFTISTDEQPFESFSFTNIVWTCN